MKRFVSLDFLRGAAIIIVLFFHMLQVVWNYEGVLAAGFPWPYWPLVIFLGFLGQFNVLFIVLSGLVNTISIDKQWRKFMKQNPNADHTGYVKRCVVKAQKALGRPLKPWIEMVHHIDENRLNDRNNNLLICTRGYHNTIHRRMKNARI